MKFIVIKKIDREKENDIEIAAKEVLLQFSLLQSRAEYNADLLPCPRCGKYTMQSNLYRNATSRLVESCHICSDCGHDEAFETVAVLPEVKISEWNLPKQKMLNNS